MKHIYCVSLLIAIVQRSCGAKGAPRILDTTAKQLVREGDTVFMTCILEDAINSTIGWRSITGEILSLNKEIMNTTSKRFSVIRKDYSFSSTTFYALRIDKLRSSDPRIFICEIFDSTLDNSATEDTELEVLLMKKHFNETFYVSDDQVKPVGDSVKFKIVLESWRAIGCGWWKPKNSVNKSGEKRFEFDYFHSPYLACSFKLRNINYGDQGIFKSKITFRADNDSYINFIYDMRLDVVDSAQYSTTIFKF